MDLEFEARYGHAPTASSWLCHQRDRQTQTLEQSERNSQDVLKQSTPKTEHLRAMSIRSIAIQPAGDSATRNTDYQPIKVSSSTWWESVKSYRCERATEPAPPTTDWKWLPGSGHGPRHRGFRDVLPLYSYYI